MADTKMSDPEMDDMIQALRNGPQMGRLQHDEIRDALRALEVTGYVLAKAPPKAEPKHEIVPESRPIGTDSPVSTRPKFDPVGVKTDQPSIFSPSPPKPEPKPVDIPPVSMTTAQQVETGKTPDADHHDPKVPA